MPALDADRLGDIALYPRLSFHYGLSFFELLHMPHWAVRLYADDLPRVLAQRQMLNIEAASFPHAKEAQQRDLLRNLGHRARGGGAVRYTEPKAKRLPRDPEHAKRELAGMGIGMTVQPKAGD